ncbi:MAG TPA: adenylate/guanylate cyclase domain-containing protein, partial [Chthonomonadaceae bacterium]|nr:adenylate/guanylate cyclase domain-containing protein [Chthonomonadaceae bacterium]
MPDMPSGTVTFLFTDIEGSTKLWEQHPEAMRSALARHDALLREAIEKHNGVVFKTVGDAFCAAFATAGEALAAALAAQQALQNEDWAETGALRVRMALHTGTAEEREGDYFGPPLNRVARLLAIGHGGQVLLSEVTQGLTSDALPSAASLQNLGEHRLRDLSRPETVFQLLHPDLPAKYPPLKSLDSPDLPNNLPLHITSFIGREQEMAEVKNLLAGTRLLTLVGLGGAGKTRLALAIGAEVLEEYPDGVWLVELAPLSEPGLVPPAVASTLNLQEEPGRALLQTLTTALKCRRMLLVLDNCEHLLSACATFADTLLRACPQVKILATSREVLGIAGETVYRVPPLALPDPDRLPSIELLMQFEAVRLFLDRATAVSTAFSITSENASAVARLCCQLDGLPLAIELAAARVRAMPVEQVASRLDDRFRLLTGGSRTALPRQQTLRALIDWSYDLLDESEKCLLRRLSVFTGGWTLEAAEAVCGADGEDVLDLLTSLVDKSLVVYEEQGDQGRYRMLETVRQYGRERLADTDPEAASVGQLHAEYYLSLAEQAAAQLLGPEQQRWLARLEREQDNLRAVLTRYQQDPDPHSADRALRLA